LSTRQAATEARWPGRCTATTGAAVSAEIVTGVVETVALFPARSVSVTVGVKLPAAPYTWVVVVPVAHATGPLPSFQSTARRTEPGGVTLSPIDAWVSVTAESFAHPVPGATVNDPLGGLSSGSLAVMTVVEMSDPAALETVRLTVYVPGLSKVWEAFELVAVDPSPKSHCTNAEAQGADFQETTTAPKSLASKPPDKVPSSAVDHGVPAIPAIWRALLSLSKNFWSCWPCNPANSSRTCSPCCFWRA